jgi:hypothetical protein
LGADDVRKPVPQHGHGTLGWTMACRLRPRAGGLISGRGAAAKSTPPTGAHPLPRRREVAAVVWRRRRTCTCRGRSRSGIRRRAAGGGSRWARRRDAGHGLHARPVEMVLNSVSRPRVTLTQGPHARAPC